MATRSRAVLRWIGMHLAPCEVARNPALRAMRSRRITSAIAAILLCFALDAVRAEDAAPFPADVGRLVSDLLSDSAARRAGATAPIVELARAQDERVLPALTRALSSPYEDARRFAVAALGEYDRVPSEAREAIVALAVDDGPDASWAVGLVARIDGVAPRILTELAAGRPTLHRVFLNALVSKPRASALPYLLERLEDPTCEAGEMARTCAVIAAMGVRDASAAACLVRLLDRTDARAYGAVLGALVAVAPEGEGLERAVAVVRSATADGTFNSPSSDREAWMRVAAARAAMGHAQPEDLARLRELLGDSDVHVAACAAYALPALRAAAAEAIPDLVAYLRARAGPDDELPDLTQMGRPGASALARFLASDIARQRSEAAVHLLRSDSAGPELVHAAVALFADPSREVRRAVVGAFLTLSSERQGMVAGVAFEFLGKLDEEDRARVVAALCSSHERLALPAAAVLNAEAKGVLRSSEALTLLAQSGNVVVPRLLTALRGPDFALAVEAELASTRLAEIPDELAEILEARTRADPEHTLAVLAALAEKSARGESLLRKRLESEDPALRSAARWAVCVAASKCPWAAPIVGELLDDPSGNSPEDAFRATLGLGVPESLLSRALHIAGEFEGLDRYDLDFVRALGQPRLGALVMHLASADEARRRAAERLLRRAGLAALPFLDEAASANGEAAAPARVLAASIRSSR